MKVIVDSSTDSATKSVIESPVLAILEQHDFTQLGVKDRLAQVEIYSDKIIIVNTLGERSELHGNFHDLPKIRDKARLTNYLKNVAIEIKQFNDGEYKLVSHVRGAGGCGTSNLLHEAVEAGNENEVRHLVENLGYNVNSTIKKGKNRFLTPLYLACEHGHLEIVKFLIAKGANVNCKVEKYLSRNDGARVDLYVESTPFYVACQNGHIDTVRLLIENRANLNEECREYYWFDFQKSTISFGWVPVFGWIVLMFCITRRKYFENKVNEVIDETSMVAKDEAELNFSDLEFRTYTRTALGRAVKQHNYPIISLLICHGANISKNCRKALSSIVENLTQEAVIKLLQKGIFSETDVISELEKIQDSSDATFAKFITKQLGEDLNYYPKLAKYIKANIDNKKLLKLEDNDGKSSDSEQVKTAEEWFEEGKRLFNQQQHKEAIECFDRVIQLETNNYQAYQMRGDAKRGKGDYKGAIEDYEVVKDSLEESNEASAAKDLKKINKKLAETSEQQREQSKEARRKKDEEELQQLRAENATRKQKEQETKLQELKSELSILKQTEICEDNLSSLNQQYQTLEKKILELQNTALYAEFYVAQGDFYLETASKKDNKTILKTVYEKALLSYNTALQYDPFLTGLAEQIEKIENKLKSYGKNTNFFAHKPTPAITPTTSTPKREELTPEQLEILEKLKAEQRQQQMKP